MSKARQYKTSHLKKLFALSGNNCAMPNCSRSLVSKDGNTVIGKICHIEAASELGPRWNIDMTEDERRDFKNLILMCSEHHDEIDDKANIKKYTTSVLKTMKEDHESGNRIMPFEVKEEHIEQVYNQLDEILDIVKISHKDIQIVKSQNDEMFNLIKEIHIATTGNISAIDKEKMATLIGENFDWVDSNKMQAFQKILANYNKTILDRREKFIFSQKITRSLFEISVLEDISKAWSKDSWNPENLDHLRFIQGGIMAYNCLEQIPKEIMNDFKMLNWGPIHHGYFDGYLGSFISEIKLKMKLNINLVDAYRNDRYLFENLNRIFISLQGYLKFDVNDLYVEKEEALIIKKLPRNFLLLNSSNKITIRKTTDFDFVLASLPLNKLFRVIKTEVIRNKDKVVIFGFYGGECFYWNPEEDITSKVLYKSEENEKITNMFCESMISGKIECYVQIKNKLVHFIDFKENETIFFEKKLDLIKSGKKFIGVNIQLYNKKDVIIYSINENFKIKPILKWGDLWEKVRADENVKSWIEINKSDDEILNHINDLNNLSVQKLNYDKKDLYLIKGTIFNANVLVIIEISEEIVEYHNIILLKKSRTITIDSQYNSNVLELCCGYLDLNRKDSVFEYIKITNLDKVESITINKERNGDLNCRDVFQICFGATDTIYLNEEGNKLYKYSFSKNEFFLCSTEENEKINGIEYIN